MDQQDFPHRLRTQLRRRYQQRHHAELENAHTALVAHVLIRLPLLPETTPLRSRLRSEPRALASGFARAPNPTVTVLVSIRNSILNPTESAGRDCCSGSSKPWR